MAEESKPPCVLKGMGTWCGRSSEDLGPDEKPFDGWNEWTAMVVVHGNLRFPVCQDCEAAFRKHCEELWPAD